MQLESCWTMQLLHARHTAILVFSLSSVHCGPWEMLAALAVSVPGWGRGSSSPAFVPLEQLRSHSPSLDDVTQINGKAGNSDNLVSVFAASLSQPPLLLSGDLTKTSTPPLTPVCLKHSPHLASTPLPPPLAFAPPLVQFHAVHCTSLLI